MVKKTLLIGISSIFIFVSLAFLVSSIDINSSTYSGYFTSGNAAGNINDTNYSGESSAFYQQAIGYLSHSVYSGIYSFTGQIFHATGTIINPKNATYITRINLPLNFSLDSSVDSIRYNLDSGANATLTGNTTFNTTNAIHTLNLFVNNSAGTTGKSVVFTMNTSAFVINYENYAGATKGLSTGFNASTLEEIQNISRAVLENTGAGKIAFNQAINLTNDNVYTDYALDLDTNTNISSNFVSINTTALPNLNKSATISLYDLTFTNPRVLRNGGACAADTCTEVSYSGGTFVFNVTQFSNYSAEETPGDAAKEGAVAGGVGSGSGSVSAENFIIDREQISITLQPGQVKTENITITNTGKNAQVIEIENFIREFIVRSEDAIVLNPGESKVVELHAIARIDTIPDIYVGKLIVSAGTLKKEILIAIEVESKDLLLDVRAEVLKPYKRVLAGEEILSEIRLFNLGQDTKRKDVEIEYVIKDYNNKTITTAHESLAIETQASFIKRFDIPEGTTPGDYILYVRAVYEDKIASSSDTFKIVPTSLAITWYIVGGILGAAILTWLILKIKLPRKRRDSGGIGNYRAKLSRYK